MFNSNPYLVAFSKKKLSPLSPLPSLLSPLSSLLPFLPFGLPAVQLSNPSARPNRVKAASIHGTKFSLNVPVSWLHSQA